MWFLKALMEHLTKAEEGYLNPNIHSHPLTFKDLRGHWCDVCRKRIQSKAYRCDQCNWDICQLCMKKKRKMRKKPKHKAKDELTTTNYMRKGLPLLAHQWKWWLA